MKKNTMMRVASALLVAVLLTTCAISGTFAKYVSKASAQDDARVARWDIELNDTSINETFVFDLFATVNDTNDSAETDVATDATTTVIAPGTQGSFDIELLNKSEVTAKYGIQYTVTNVDSIPVKFSVDNGNTWKNTLDEVVAHDENTKLAMDATKATVITVQWKWDYEVGADADAVAVNDSADTGFGEAATLSAITVKADITVTQVD